MAIVSLKNGRKIGDKCPPYIVAELNSSHYGKVETAKQMIKAAKDCGCDCIKIQSWSAESLYCEEYYKNNPISKRIVSKFALNENAIEELALYCKSLGIDFSSTPYSKAEVDFLTEKIKVPFLKISSMEINNLPFLRYIASKGTPLILSTGMSTIEEIRDAINAIENEGNRQLCILHCVSMYPAAPSIINLNNLSLLKEEFPEYPIGYSDHTLGYEIAAASVALGAGLIEKHFTLDNTKMGMDNNMATEPEDMKNLVIACRNVFSAMGSKERKLLHSEEEQRLKMRRSLVTIRDMRIGDVLTEADIEAKRPGDGIQLTEVDKALGKIINRDIPKGYVLRWEYLK